MSNITITYDGAPLAADVPATKITVPQRAELGTQSNGGISPEDPAASLNLVGWRPISVDELDCSQPRLFTGFVFDRNVGRSFGQTQFVGADARIHDTTITDLNAVFQLRIISGSDGNRPSETMDARMAWILGSDYLAGSAGVLIEDTGHVLTGLTRPMDASDYRGSYPGDVLNDLANRSQDAFNWFAFWDPAPTSGSPRPGLFFDYVGAAVMDCTLSISNVLADLSSTCFAPITESRLERTPETVYSDVIVEYKGGGQVVRHAPATEAAHIKRGTKIDRPYTGQASTAESQGDDYLAMHSKETDRITTTIHVPSSVVGLLWAGQRMQARFSHLPGYEATTWMRVVASSPRAVDDLALAYDVDLELIGTPLGPQGAFAFFQLGDPFHATPVLPHATTPGHLLVAVVTYTFSTGEPLTNVPDLRDGDGSVRSWSVGSAWTAAYDPSQYGGPGGAAGFGIWWRRVAAGETTTTPLAVVESNASGALGVSLWEFDTPTDPTGGISFTTGTSSGSGIASGGAVTIGSALSGFILGGLALQQPNYEYRTVVAAVVGTEVQNTDGANTPNVMLSIYTPPRWIATDGGGGPLEATITYVDFLGGGSVLSPIGIAGGAIELPGVTSVPTIPYPADQIVGTGVGSVPTSGGTIPTVNSTITTTAPTATNDSAHGYATGSTWLDTSTGTGYLLTDDTAGAAVWTETTGGGVTDHGALTGLADDDHTQYVLKRYGGKEVVATVAAATATETLDLADGNLHDVTLTVDCTLTFAGATTGVACSFTLWLRQDGTGGWVTTWPGSVIWSGGTAPAPDTTASTLSEFVFETIDGGTTWLGHAIGTGGGASTTGIWMPLTTVMGGVPDLVWDADDSLIPTEVL